ncbi:MAG: thioredoxin domain-containing protein [Candidatus Micrarchaeota archaeon]
MSTESVIHQSVRGSSDPTPIYALSLTILIIGLVLSASVYFSASMLTRSLDAKSFSSPNVVLQPVLNITVPSGSNNAAAPSANNAAAPGAVQGAGCGINGAPPPSSASVDVTGRAIKGPTNAKVTLVEFSDFQCPYCVRVQPTIAQLLKEYPTQINLVHMNFIVHPAAKPAHVATECAGDQGKYWEMHDKIFSTQKTDDASLRQMASDMGLDLAKYDACIAAGKDATLNAQKAIGTSLGIGGTPSFVIGKNSGGTVSGSLVVGAQDISAFRTAINAQLAK